MNAAAAASPVSSLLQAFDWQQRWCREPAPFTARLLQRARAWLAVDPAAHAAFSAAAADPLAAALPLRFAGALHHLALRGLDPWASIWRDAAQAPAADATAPELDLALDHAVRLAYAAHLAHVAAALARAPQTNEVQRSVALLPGLLHVAARTGLPLALLEMGASAGLNLWCDHYLHDHGSWRWGPADAALTLRCDWQGGVPAQAALHIAERAACDAHPVDLAQPDEALRLASFIWPDQPARGARLQAACRAVSALMQAASLRVQGLPAVDFVARELALPRPGRATVLMHSVMWQYMTPLDQGALSRLIQAAGTRATAAAPLAWLRLEPQAEHGGAELRCRLWPDGRDRLLARVHPHGAQVHWLDQDLP